MPDYLKQGYEIARLGAVTRKPRKEDFYNGMEEGELGRPLPDDVSREYEVGHAVGMNIREKAGEGI
tara:strand:- start:1093 stop:1290 length:198 start_codon:yes stop_codon:yes gene_type:complete